MSVNARPAATVLLVRPDRRILLVQRSHSLPFFGGAYAFAGGRVDVSDVHTAMKHPWQDHTLPPAGTELTDSLDLLYGAYVAAAVREVKEETGIKLEAKTLVLWSRWITPEIEPKRYDTLFFIAPVDADTVVQIDGGETVSHQWLTPEMALSAWQRKDIHLPPPTWVTLTELRQRTSRAAMLEPGPVPEIMPLLYREGEALMLVLPGDPGHPYRPARPWPADLVTRTIIAPR